MTMIYIIIGFILRLFLIIVEQFTEFPKYHREVMDIIENDVLGFSLHRQINNNMTINIDNNLDYKSTPKLIISNLLRNRV